MTPKTSMPVRHEFKRTDFDKYNYDCTAKKVEIARGRFPKPGDLIRSNNTGDFINLVINVSEPRPASSNHHGARHTVLVISVRYARMHEGVKTLLKGERARPFEWSSDWEIVKEFVVTEYDNSKEIKEHLATIDGKELVYRPTPAMSN